MKGMSLQQFTEISEFVQKHHRFGFWKTEEQIKESIESGIHPDLAKYGLNIKYVRCSYDTRFGDVWAITLDRVHFATNHFNVAHPPPKQWKYENIYDLTMAYLKGNFKPKEEFFI